MKLSVLVFGAISLMLMVPLPHRVYGTLELEPAKPQNVFVEVSGQLADLYVERGQIVQPGTVIGRLKNLDLELQIHELVAQRDIHQAQLAGLRFRSLRDPIARAQVPEIEETLAAFEKQLAKRLCDRDHLTLVALQAGTVLPAPEHPRQPAPNGELSRWSGSAFDQKNIDCYLEASTLLCQIGDPRHFEAIVVLDQADMAAVMPGQVVDIKLNELPGEIFSGYVEEVSMVTLKQSPRRSSNKSGGELATKTDLAGVERPMSVSYQVRVPVEAAAGVFQTGFCGKAKIYTHWESLSTRVWRWFCQTFHFRW